MVTNIVNKLFQQTRFSISNYANAASTHDSLRTLKAEFASDVWRPTLNSNQSDVTL